jgi:hypothetical protein
VAITSSAVESDLSLTDSDPFSGVEFHGHMSLADSSHTWRFAFVIVLSRT